MNFAFDDFELQTEPLELRRAGTPVKADRMVLRLLEVLLRSPGKLVTKDQLIERVWQGRAVSENVITVAMVRLRKALGHKPGEREFINNVHGRGYRFVPSVSPASARAAASAEPGGGHADPRPFVGRESALASLREALQDAVAGRGSLCVLSGEAGIGKTRSVEELEREALASGVPVAWGHCREVGDTPPLWPFAQLVREVLDKQAVDLRQGRLASTLPELGRLLPELAEPAQPRAPSPTPALGNQAKPGKHQMFDAIVRVLGAAAESTPYVLVLDDLHRADSASLELLSSWLDELPRRKLLVVATLRSLETPRPLATQIARIHGHRNTRRVPLERLGEDDVATYVRALFPGRDPSLSRAIHARCAGNPLFMAELARALLHAGGDDPQLVALPAPARDLVLQRLSALAPQTREALSLSAVIGRGVELSLLQTISERPAAELMGLLDEALTRELIVADPRNSMRFEFGHELLREALYDALAPAQRREYHLRVGRALDQRLRAGESGRRSEVAHHLYAALPDGDLRMTVRYCGHAAEDAAELYAYSEAAEHLRRARQALDLLEGASPRLRLGLLLREALCIRVVGDREFETLARAALRLARAQNDGASLASAGLLLDLNPGFPPLTGSREALEEALRALPAEDRTMRAAVLARLATSAPLAFDARASLAQVAQARELARADAIPIAEYGVLAAELHLCGGPTQRARALEAMRAIDALCRQHAAMMSVPPVLVEIHRAINAYQEGALGPREAALERGRALCRKLGGPELLWHVERFELLAQLAAERPGAADRLRALHLRAEQDHVLGGSLFIAYDLALGLDTQVPARARPSGAFEPSSDDTPNLWSMKLRGLTALGQLDEARTALGLVAPAALSGMPCDRDYLGTFGAVARAALQLDARDYIEALIPLLEPYPDHFAVNVSFFCEGSIAQLLGFLHLALGRRDAAIPLLQRGLTRCEQVGLPGHAREARAALERL